MRPEQLIQYLEFAIPNRENVLVTGKPGSGKSDIMKQVAAKLGYRLLISHPVVSDPTDFKGLPYAANGKADFLPFGDLRELMEAQEPLVWFLDDLGQAPSAVQASLMQILLERSINGHRISDKVSIVSATNRKQDKAAVSGILAPVKSRFASIVELEVNHNDWVNWALENGMPMELIAFVRMRPDLLTNAVESKDIENTASPRTIAAVGRQQAEGLPKDLYHVVFKGAAGYAFAAEYCGFLELYNDLPSVDEILMNPTGAALPQTPAGRHAICAALAHHSSQQNIAQFLKYADRLPKEHTVAYLKDAVIRHKDVAKTEAYIRWVTNKDNAKLLM